MNCSEMREQIYGWHQGTLSPEDRTVLERHLKDCRNCQGFAEDLKKTLVFLNAIPPPPLSRRFMETVLVKSSSVHLPSRSVWERFREWLQIPYLKWPLEGLAATALILIALFVYKDFNAARPSKVEVAPRSFSMEFSKTKAGQPIILSTKNIDKTLGLLQDLIRDNQGQIIRIVSIDRDKKVVFSLERNKEAEFMSGLRSLGPVQTASEGFRDGEGNIVIILKWSNP